MNHNDRLGNPVPPSEWVWDGHALHLIVGPKCQFHLATRVGDYLISTVGEYVSGADTADGGRYGEDYSSFDTVGVDRLFETFVFRAHGAGFGDVDEWGEIDSEPANDHDTATRNHMAMCEKYARMVTDGN